MSAIGRVRAVIVALIAGIPGADPPSARTIIPENGARAA